MRKEETQTCAQGTSSAIGWVQEESASNSVFRVQLCWVTLDCPILMHSDVLFTYSVDFQFGHDGVAGVKCDLLLQIALKNGQNLSNSFQALDSE